MSTHISHGIHATIQAPVEEVWTVLGAFGDYTWNTLATDVHLVGTAPVDVGSVRQMHAPDGAAIRERLLEIGPNRRFVYTFDGPAPIPVTSSRTTVRAAPSTGSPDTSTTVSWAGEYDVADDDTGRAVEDVNCQVVWPSTIGAWPARSA
jgi:uncharacterized protein YndB with AHSA1/START domain